MPIVAICNIVTVRKRVISALQSNRTAPYSGAVGTGSSTNSRYQSTTEITDAILEVDSLIVQARLSNPGDPYRSQFMSASASIPNNTMIPAHVGAQGNLDIDTGSGFVAARTAKSRAEMAEVLANPTLYPSAAGWGIIEDSQVLYDGDNAQVWIPSFVKTTVCQAPETDELAEVMGTIGMLPKDGSVTPELYSTGASYLAAYIQMLQGKNVTLPETEQLEKMLIG